jgi:hypothetical protein
MKEKAETDIRSYGVRAGKINACGPSLADQFAATGAIRGHDAARCTMMS